MTPTPATCPGPAPAPDRRAVPDAATTAVAWQRAYWDDLSRHGDLRAVIDPADDAGEKNRRLDAAHQRALRRFLRRANVRRIGTVLDFGCGIGRHHDLLADLAERYVGVDVAEGMIRRAPGDVRLIDGTTLPFDDATIDGAFSFWVLQHVVEDVTLGRIAAELHRVLRPGGVLVMCERSGTRPDEPGRAADYIHRRPPETYVACLGQAGFALRCARPLRAPRHPWRRRRWTNEGDNLYAFVR